MPASTHKMAMPIVAETALRAYLPQKMVADATISLKPIVKGLTGKTWTADKAKIKPALDRALKGKLAKDADIEDVVDLLDSLDDVAEEVAAELEAQPDAEGATDADDVDVGKLRDALKAKGMSDEDIDAIVTAAKGGGGAPTPPAGNDKEPPITKAALDAAIADAARTAEASTVARMAGIREAEKVIRPWVGDLAITPAQDSAEAVYKLALDTMQVKVEGVHPSAYRAVLEAQRKPGDTPPARPRLATDAAADKGYGDRFPNANRLRATR